MSKTKSGFTIIELLVVIVVIVILATITVVVYIGARGQAQIAAFESDQHAADIAIKKYAGQHSGTYPASITDCPTPAETNICLTPSNGAQYVYKVIPQGQYVQETSYSLAEMGEDHFLYKSSMIKTSPKEFMRYDDFAPMIDKYGLVKYKLSFDIRSADISSANTIRAYFQNGSSARYGGLVESVPVQTTYTHHELTFTPTKKDMGETESMLAFYGQYTTGNIPTVKNVRLQLAQ